MDRIGQLGSETVQSAVKAAEPYDRGIQISTGSMVEPPPQMLPAEPPTRSSVPPSPPAARADSAQTAASDSAPEGAVKTGSKSNTAGSGLAGKEARGGASQGGGTTVNGEDPSSGKPRSFSRGGAGEAAQKRSTSGGAEQVSSPGKPSATTKPVKVINQPSTTMII